MSTFCAVFTFLHFLIQLNPPNIRYNNNQINKTNERTSIQLAYLMEPDSVPLQRFWLDRLRKEIEERRPFAVLGSKYRGDNWYDFFRQLSIPLINHLNGNAVYNVSNVLMNLMLSQLEMEADQIYNFIPFDLRMAQVCCIYKV
jgi:hypothetical protein